MFRLSYCSFFIENNTTRKGAKPMPDRYLESLVCPLPDDIARLIGAGEIDLALQLIERRLAAQAG